MKLEVRKLSKRAYAVAAILLCLLLFPPWRPAMPSAGLDPAWFAVIAHAITQGWQFGRDIVFTYGPLGFLAPPFFYPGLFQIAIVFWLIFYAVFAMTLVALYAQASAWRLVALVVLLFAGLSPMQDARVFSACVLLFLIGRQPGRAATGLAIALTALQAGAALMKMTYAAVAFPIIVLTDIARFAQSRRPPVLTPIFVLSYLAAYLAAGQEIEGLFTYLTAAAAISGGFSEAMVTYGPMREIVAFVVIASAGMAVITWRELRGAGTLAGTALTLCVFGIIIFVAAKAGFVRHDLGHAIIPWLVLTLAFTGYLGHLRGLQATAMTALILMSLGYFASTHLLLTKTPVRTASPPQQLTEDVFNIVLADFDAVTLFVFRGQYQQRLLEWPEFLAHIAKTNPLPQFDGPTDISGGEQAILLAHAADYRPRPVFQGYLVYTPDLARKNAEFLRSEKAPNTILFKVASIDDRLPALDDGALWLELFRLYDVVNFDHGYAVLKRRANAREVTVSEPRASEINFGSVLDVSEQNRGVVWAEIDLNPSYLGRLRNILFKPALVDIVLTLTDGRTIKHRIIPGMAQAGFVLSPYIHRTDEFVTLSNLQEPRVASVTIGTERLAKYFRQPLTIRLSGIHIAEDDDRPSTARGCGLLVRRDSDGGCALVPPQSR